MPERTAVGDGTWDRLQADFYLVGAGGTPYHLRPPASYDFGRNPSASFAIRDAPLSRRHASLGWDPAGRWVVEDLGSRNGTFVNEQRLTAPRPLADLDVLRVGGRRFTFYSLPRGTNVAEFLRAAERTFAGTINGAPPGEIEGAVFSGHIDKAGLLPLLEFLAMTRKTGRLDLDGGRRVWCTAGDPVDAAAGEAVGEEALNAIAAEPGATFTFRDGLPPPAGRRITQDGRTVRIALARPSSVMGVDARDLARAQTLQARLMPKPPALPGWEFGFCYAPHAVVGGDLYDIAPLPDGRMLVALGDVSGHGVQGAMVVALALKSLRLLRRERCSLAELVGRLDADLGGDLVPGQFLTVSAAAVDPADGRTEVVLAGHHPVFIVRADGRVERLGQPAPAVGLMHGRLTAHLHPAEGLLAPGDLLLQLTDGILEAADASQQEFATVQLDALLPGLAGMSAQEAADRIIAAVQAHAETIDDDLTLVAIRRLPG
jgi:hypothetical protein